MIDLESDRSIYRDLAVAALYSVAELTLRNKQLARRNDEQRKQIAALMAAPCLACQRRARADASELATV